MWSCSSRHIGHSWVLEHPLRGPELATLFYAVIFGIYEPISQILHNAAADSGHMISDQSGFFSMMFYSEDAEIKPLFTAASIAGALFGGVHCLAWHFSFPSQADQILWRVASSGIVSTWALSFVGTWILDLVDDLRTEYQAMRKISRRFLLLLIIILMLISSVMYFVSRLMLLVLAVTSLRSLPSSALDTVNWVEIVPHIWIVYWPYVVCVQ